MNQPNPSPGYTYRCSLKHWKNVRDDNWENAMLPEGRLKFVGQRVIDGSPCNVWRRTYGRGLYGPYYAQVRLG